MALRSLTHCQTPPKILNIAGPETLSVRLVAEEFGKKFSLTPKFFSEEQSTALLSDASESFKLFGYPKVPLKTMMNIIAEWIKQGGKILNKPTHFQERKGQF
jgi:hypothetical protein